MFVRLYLDIDPADVLTSLACNPAHCRLLIVREGSEAEIDALYKEAIHLQDDKAEKDLMALDHRTAALMYVHRGNGTAWPE